MSFLSPALNMSSVYIKPLMIYNHQMSELCEKLKPVHKYLLIQYFILSTTNYLVTYQASKSLQQAKEQFFSINT